MKRLRKYIIWILEGITIGGGTLMLLGWYIHFSEILLYGFVITLMALLAIWIIRLVMQMGKKIKSFELVDVDGYGLADYATIKEACQAASDHWKLRIGWSINKISTTKKKELYLKTYPNLYFNKP